MASHKNAASAKLKGPRNASARVQHAAKNMYRAKPLAATRVVAAAVSVAAVGVFGAVAFELAQSNLSFDPSGYIAAYSHGDAESGEAYRISPLSTDAEANLMTRIATAGTRAHVSSRRGSIMRRDR